MRAVAPRATASPLAERHRGGRGPITFAASSRDSGVMGRIVAEWNVAHPAEKVALRELAAEADTAQDQLVRSLSAAHGDYDVMTLDLAWTAQFVSEGWLQPLDGTLALDTSDVFPAALESATIDGTLYAAPMATNTQLLYYRMDLTPQPPADWQGLLDSRPIAEERGLDCLITQLMRYEGLTINATQFIHSWGGSVVGPDGVTSGMDAEQSQAGLRALAQAYACGAIAKRSITLDEAATAAIFARGEAMYAYNWPYMSTVVENAATSKVAGKVGVAPILGPEGVGAGTLAGYNSGIDIHSERKATARDFVAFLQGETSQRMLAESAYSPVRISMYDDAELISLHPYFPVLRTALLSARARPLTPRYPAVSGSIQVNAGAVLRRGGSVEDAAAAISDKIKDLYGSSPATQA